MQGYESTHCTDEKVVSGRQNNSPMSPIQDVMGAWVRNLSKGEVTWLFYQMKIKLY